MRVTVKSVLQGSREQKVVFSTVHGEGIAIWTGEPPVEDRIYDVDVEVPSILVWGRDVHYTDSNPCSIEIVNNSVCFRGKLESISIEDGCCVVRVGDSIILLEVEGAPTQPGSFVQFQVETVFLYDNNL